MLACCEIVHYVGMIPEVALGPVLVVSERYRNLGFVVCMSHSLNLDPHALCAPVFAERGTIDLTHCPSQSRTDVWRPYSEVEVQKRACC